MSSLAAGELVVKVILLEGGVMKFILSICLSFSSIGAWGAAPTSYDCDLMILSKDLKDGIFEVNFVRPAIEEGKHGGDPIRYAAGPFEVYLLVDGKWRSVSWWREGKVIAEAITLAQDIYPSDHVVILYNPENREEQVSLNCQPKE